MEKLCELQKQVRNYIINELKEYATIIDDNENIKITLSNDEENELARKVNMKFCITFNIDDITKFEDQYRK